MIVTKTLSSSKAEYEEMDPVGKPNSEQREVETDIPKAPESERVVQPELPNE